MEKITQSGFLKIIDRINPSWWNRVSYLYSFMTRHFIGSPISFFNEHGFCLREFGMLDMPEGLRRDFLNFCYPQDLPGRAQELEYDRQYWPHCSAFVVWDRCRKIIGCVQFIVKEGTVSLPVEYATVVGGEERFNVTRDVGSAKASEIYRLRRSFNLDAEKINHLVSMLFKATWAKIIQTNMEYVYITCDANSRELRNLYLRRLFFQDTKKLVRFGKSGGQWRLLRKDCFLHEKRFAGLSRKHFYLQTYFRANLKTRVLRKAA
jgi:hypothetical protein